MYGDPELIAKARAYRHCTMQEAARMAAEAEIPPREMWFTHYSPSMTNPKQYLDEMREIFPAVKCGRDGMTAELNYDD